MARNFNRAMIDQYQGMLSSGQLIPNGNPFATYMAGRNRVDEDRWSRRVDPNYSVPGSMSLPDTMWDGFFGALQNREQLVDAAGGRMRTDLLGDGPSTGTGFGRWTQRDEGGQGYTTHLDALSGLQSAAGTGIRRSKKRKRY